MMKVSDIMVADVASVASEDPVAKAFSVMIDRSINQLPLVDEDGRYSGMVFAKHLLSSSAPPTSKLKSYAVKTQALRPDEDVEKAAKMVLGSGNRALPVVGNGGRLAGIVSETDIAQTADFGHATVDEVMSGAIVIEEDTPLADAMSKMRRYNISRLPVINNKGLLRGVVNILDAASIVATPKERTSKSAAITGSKSRVQGDVKVKDIMRRAVSVERGTRMNELAEHFKRSEEVVVVGDGRPMGIVTPKDALELVLPKKDGPAIHMAHLEDDRDRREIEDQLLRFVKKIQGKLGDIQSVVVYADKHKTRKYSVRCRLITAKGVVNAKAVGYDPLSASKELIEKLDRQIKTEHTQKVKGRQHRETARKVEAEEEV
ncbi:putative transcriptional regulator, contains C-terminal CBS domains [Candidatus Nitrososphaera evergladensis SR1]|jgi:CBS domain-containing protein/ribosome-associated translation inhibitor RaiA|uniref:Putative transcriptional regulator, contains C-terminal CBS domains n=1 Tax=Candidatus Nitrososphaera evergladensis SR1 TaxID=1459636 RepID=A0A075MU98_9ARCH|nr:CBS domain-containing protein [Candidatus Nitrososphaera evergladensis]AIF85216.1 putative transcriptional regulator, contains C-terminal CBS domains [Candidatus Nitrososphaera evergladensis SR1]